MTDLLSFQRYYLVGIKGVAMTALAQMLHDAGKEVRGSDVPEAFVTQELLDAFHIPIDTSFDASLPPDTDVVIFTSAHQSHENKQVKEAQEKGVPTITQAEAIADLFNRQKGIAVSGVGGKSTTSAMLTWILEKLGKQPSFFVGVGNIPGIERTGKWNPAAEYLVAEADEYVTNPGARERGETIIPKFSFLHPYVTICTNLEFDHPDVYDNFEHTLEVYTSFFTHTNPQGALIVNTKDKDTIEAALRTQSLELPIQTFGSEEGSTLQLISFTAQAGKTTSLLKHNDNQYTLELIVPGVYNVMNAMAALLACMQIGISLPDAAQALSSFRSTKRRFEFIGEKNGVLYYDDYAHHPHEIESVIKALNEWYPTQRKVVAFQSHTYTRTKRLFEEFVDSFSQATEVIMIDIFSSAREQYDPSVSSTLLCEAIAQKFGISAKNLGTIEHLAQFCKEQLHSGDVLITVGAGDIYEVHSQL